MFDDLRDPDPPTPDIGTLADVTARARRMRRRRDAMRVVALGVVAGFLVGALAFVVDGDPDRQSDIAESIDAGDDAVIDIADLVTSTLAPAPGGTDPGITVASSPTAPTTTPTTASTSATSTPTTSTTTTTTTTTTVLPAGTESIPFLAVGDMVMLGAAPELTSRGLLVDAAVSRQMIDMIPVFEQFRDQGLFGNAVVVHLGTNGPFDQATLDSLLATLDEVPNVILMTVRADRAWTAENNALIRAADRQGDNKILIDWEVRSADCPGECFSDDGIHLRPDGQEYYADLIADVLGI